jgi:hypothetical protein
VGSGRQPVDRRWCPARRLDPQGRPTVTAHRFRHTIGTHLAEGGARLQTIMAVLGHRTLAMSLIYASLSDPAVKQQYQEALDRRLGPDVILAGLGDEGWQVDSAQIRYGFDTAVVVRSAFTALPLDQLHLPVTPALSATCAQRVALTRYLVDVGRGVAA